MVPHGRRAWALPPNTEMVETNVAVRVNSLALRGPELRAKQPRELRMLTLGDSSVFGFGVAEEDVFSSVAAAKLSAALNRPVTPVIGATPGYTSVQALHTLQDVGLYQLAAERYGLATDLIPGQVGTMSALLKAQRLAGGDVLKGKKREIALSSTTPARLVEFGKELNRGPDIFVADAYWADLLEQFPALSQAQLRRAIAAVERALA